MLLCPCAGANDKCNRVLTQARIPLGLKFYDYVLLCPGLIKKYFKPVVSARSTAKVDILTPNNFHISRLSVFQPLYTRGEKNILEAPILNLSPLALQAPALTTRPWHKMWNVFFMILETIWQELGIRPGPIVQLVPKRSKARNYLRINYTSKARELTFWFTKAKRSEA